MSDMKKPNFKGADTEQAIISEMTACSVSAPLKFGFFISLIGILRVWI